MSCPSVYPHLWGGGYPSQVQLGGAGVGTSARSRGVPQPGPGGGATPARSRQGGTPARSRWGGTPPWVPPSDLAGGYPDGGCTPPQCTLHQTWLGGTPPWVPPVRPGQEGYPDRRYPTLGNPPIRPGQGGTMTGGYHDRGVPHLG